MKLHVFFWATSGQKLTEVDDEHKHPTFYGKFMSTEVAIDALSEEWKDYVVRMNVVNNKVPVKRCVLTHAWQHVLAIAWGAFLL